MMETEVTAQDGKFFQNDTDKTAEFLIWLKNKLDSRDVHRIILIDPYIEEESILKFVRCVGIWELLMKYIQTVMRENRKNAKRIQGIRDIRESLKLVIPPHFLVKTSTHSANVLHDRLLILVGKILNPSVYALTNSLDSMAKKQSLL